MQTNFQHSLGGKGWGVWDMMVRHGRSMLKSSNKSANLARPIEWRVLKYLRFLSVVAAASKSTHLAEDHVEPALVGGVGNDHQDGEEEQGDDSLPDLHSVLGGDYQTWD